MRPAADLTVGAVDERVLLDAVPTGLVGFDHHGVIVYVNRRAAEILELAPGALRGRRLDAVAPELASALRRGRADGPDQPACAHRTPSGQELRLGFRIADAGDGPRPLRILMMQDVTDRERVREERDKLLRIAAVGEVMPAMLHELRNPLAAATTALEVTLEDLAPGRLQVDLHAVLGELRRMRLTLEGAGLVNVGWADGRNAAADLALQETWRVLEPQLRTKGLRGRCAVPPLPLLPIDPALLRAVTFNLLNNAIQACRPGDSVELGARLASGPALEFWVADSGPGMSPEVLARCQELFFTTKPNGTGIGLALCASAAQRTGGRLDVDSQPGQGTRVTIRIPTAGDPARPAAP